MTGIYGLKPWFRRALMGIVKGLGAMGIHPDVLTLAAIPTGALMGLVLFVGRERPSFLWLLLPLAVLRLAFNAMDGLLAQVTGKARPFGEVLNEFSDRVTDILIYSGLPLGGWITWAQGFWLIALTLSISFLGVSGRAAGAERQFGGPFGKADRTLLAAAAGIVVAIRPELPAFVWFFWGAWPLGMLTVALRFRRIHRDLRQR